MSAHSELEYGSYLDYSSSGSGKESIRSKGVCHTIKQNWFFPGHTTPSIPYTVDRLAAIIQGSCLADFFAPKTVLVPCPRSSLMKAGSLYPAKIACESLASAFPCTTIELLDRVEAVPKAAYALKGARPTVLKHIRSMRVIGKLPDDAKSILLVDDVVTRGTMFLASASLLREAFPKIPIRAFALVRTMSGVEVEQIENPDRGKITLLVGHGERRP